MKPLRMVLSAFGSYAGEETVDFEKLDHGIFLITGDTGAGKTTIFDGVAYALFGECSVRSRDGGMMRSQYAADGQETYVSLRFSHDGKVYEVTRSPGYARVSRRKNKAGEYARIQVQAKARLLLPDGREQPGNVRDVNRKLQEILGVDHGQFSQIAMIAQGDYLKLLHASSRERKEIFSRIFNTGIYSRIQQKLKEENNRLYTSLEDDRKLIAHELENVEAPDGERAETWRELIGFQETGAQKLRAALGEMLEVTEARRQEIRDKKREISRERSQLEIRIRQAEEDNRLFLEWEREKQTLEGLSDREGEQAGKRGRLASSRRAEKVAAEEKKFRERQEEQARSALRRERLTGTLRELAVKREEAERHFLACDGRGARRLPAIQERMLRLRDILPLFGEWRQAEGALSAAQKEAEWAEGTYRLAQREVEEELSRQKELAEKGEELEAAAAGLSALEQERDRVEGKRERLLALGKAVRHWRRDGERLASCQEELFRAMEEYDRAEAAYGRLYRAFLAAQAGLMAASLEEGVPCPVCGSTHHPALARSGAEHVTQAGVEAAREARDRAEKSRSAASQEAVRMREGCRQQEGRIREEMGTLEEFLPKGTEADGGGETWPALVEAALKVCEEKRKEIGRKRKEAADARRLLEENRRERKEAAHRQREAERKKGEAEGAWQDKKVGLAVCRAAADQMKKRLPQTEESAVQEELAGLEKERARLEEEREEAQQYRDGLLQEEKEAKGRLRAEEENGVLLARAASQAERAYLDRMREQGFTRPEEWREALLEEGTAARWEQECKDYEEMLLRSRTIDAQYERQLQGRQKRDTQDWREAAVRLQEQQDRLEEEEIRLTGICGRNRQAHENLERLWQTGERLEEEYGAIRALYETANGRMAGAAGLDFQTYVQRQYFIHMIDAANRRLKVLAEGRFLLQCRELDALGKQGEVGLDLDVYSLETDRVRDVKTLSGGESFLAALAMALGMADVIQAAAGNVKIDALFIDEGFGSLDEESRLRAIRILQQLAEGRRLVGIISHVPELKEQMERQLLVRKTEKGSHIEWRL